MSSVNIIAIIIALLSVLVCYAFIAQTVKQRQDQRNRLLAALKARSRNFKFMLNGFPAGFLPKELTLLVQRGLIDVCEQLAKVEPREPLHMQDLQTVFTSMAEVQRQTKPHSAIPIENPQQMKEVKLCLEELNRFIHGLEAKHVLAQNQAETFRGQIRQLVLQLTVDNYELQGRQARQASKTKLAHHYYDLSIKLLVREGKPGQFDARIAKMKAILAGLSKQLHDEEQVTPVTDQELAEQEEIASEWDKFDSDEDIWKKKHVYD